MPILSIPFLNRYIKGLNNMNKSKLDMIIRLNKEKPNCYTLEENVVSDFIGHAAKELRKKTKVSGKITEFYHVDEVFGSINGLLPGSTGKIAYRICKNKFETEKLLEWADLPTLNSSFFTHEQLKEAKDFIDESVHSKFVLKPISLGSGKGIIFDVDRENIEESWNRSLEIQRNRKIEEPSFILQNYLDGFDVRICIVEGKFACALWRVQPHVVGDGNSTVRELITRKNEQRQKSVYFQRFLYNMDEVLIQKVRSQKKELDSILDKNEVLILSDLGNLAAGAESVDITKIVGENLINLALKSVAAVPGLYTAGVDILTENLNADTGYIIEINTNANHKVHYMPYHGEIRAPYKNLMENMLIKYKLKAGLGLDQQERRIYRDITKFNNYKEMYHSKLTNLLMQK